MKYRESDRYKMRRIRVLLVEDEPLLLRLLGEMLGRVFPALRRAGDGREGLEIGRKWSPDIVVTDLNIPEPNGLEMLRKLREHQPELPAVVFSAYSERERLMEAIDTGVEKYLLKPFDPEEMLGVVKRLAGKIVSDMVLDLPGSFSFDRRSGLLYHRDRLVRLTSLECRLFRIFSERPGRLLEPREISEELWRERSVPETRLRSLISRVRGKTDPQLIETCRGRGYRLVPASGGASRH